MEKRAFWMALVALMLSIGTIGVMIMGVWEMSVIDSNTFISTIVGLMTLVFTLLVGYQIYNAITAREKMDAMKSDMDVKLKEIEYGLVSIYLTISKLIIIFIFNI